MNRTTLSDITAPIGVFDSGLGGLTVVRRMQEMLPDEQIIYVADQAHVPYGGRDLRQINDFACGISTVLLRSGCKALVMACNISSAIALTSVQRDNPEIPVLGVILPGAEAAIMRTLNRKVGVLATQGTVQSGAYTRALQALDPGLTVIEIACPRFVPLVEAGQEGTPEARCTAQEYLRPLVALGVDTVVLGCTHYPFLLPMLRSLQPHLAYVDPAEQTTHLLIDLLRRHDLLAPPSTSSLPAHHLFTTGDRNAFATQLCRFLPRSADAGCIRQATWRDGVLHLPDFQ